MDLNHATDRLAELMFMDQTLISFGGEAITFGATGSGGGPGADWMARTQGYEKYLAIWPDGLWADEAGGMGPLSHGTRSGAFLKGRRRSKNRTTRPPPSS